MTKKERETVELILDRLEDVYFADYFDTVKAYFAIRGAIEYLNVMLIKNGVLTEVKLDE